MWRLWLSKFGNAVGGWDWVNSQMQFGHYPVTLEMHLEVVPNGAKQWSKTTESVSSIVGGTLPNILRDFVRSSGFGWRSIGSGSEDIIGYPAGRNHSNCVDLYKLSNHQGDQDLEMIECVYSRVIRWCLSTTGFPHFVYSQSLSQCPLDMSVNVLPDGFHLANSVPEAMRNGFCHHNFSLALCGKHNSPVSSHITTYPNLNQQMNNMNQKEWHIPNAIPYTKWRNINLEEKRIGVHSVCTSFCLPPSGSALHIMWYVEKYEMLPHWESNCTVTLVIVYMAAVICSWASINSSASVFTACWNMGTVLFPNYLSWCATVGISSFNILLHSWLRVC